MKVKLLISRADATRAYGVGEIVDVPDGEAMRLIEAGKAVAAGAKPARENTAKKRVTEKRD
jgi:hypothetical protein